MTMRSSHSWSLLNPRPCLIYLQKHDEYIVYWNGIVMPHSMALSMSMEKFGIYPSMSMKAAMIANYHRLYYANAFETREWDQIVNSESLYSYLRNLMHPHIFPLIEASNREDVIRWFDYSKAIIEE